MTIAVGVLETTRKAANPPVYALSRGTIREWLIEQDPLDNCFDRSPIVKVLNEITDQWKIIPRGDRPR